MNHLSISKLTLGTVALGLDYGISNSAGRPGEEESFGVLRCALDAGINTLDTARSYGTAEEVIGRFLEKERAGMPVNVVSKFKMSPDSLHNQAQLRQEALQSVRASLDRLKLSQLPVCLLHIDSTLPTKQVAALLPALLRELQEKGLIAMGGISADQPGEVEFFLDIPEVQAIQAPLSVFDQRLVRNGLLESMRQGNKLFFARSIFLQGLFFMNSSTLSGNLAAAGPYLDRLQEIARNGGLSVPQLALSFVRDMEAVTSIVFGAVSPAQVQQNVQLLQGEGLSSTIRSELGEAFGNMPEVLVTPRAWSPQTINR